VSKQYIVRLILALLLCWPLAVFAVDRDLDDCTIGSTPTALAPLDLDNCTISDGDDISGILSGLASTYGDVYVRAPSRTANVVAAYTVFTVDDFYFLEDEDGRNTFLIQHKSVNAGTCGTPCNEFWTLWSIQNFNNAVIGGPKLSITIQGNHPGLANCDAWPSGWTGTGCDANRGLVEFRMSDGSVATLADVRANIRFSQHYAIYTWGSINRTTDVIEQFNVAGLMYATSGVFFHQGVKHAWGDPDRLVVSDPYVRAWGWDGVQRATMDRGLPMGCNDLTKDQNRGTSFTGYYTETITGGVTLEYGAMNWVIRETGTVGSASAPFVIRLKDWYVSGPGTQYPAGVRVKKTGQAMVFKGDPHDRMLDGANPTRFVRAIKLPDDYGSGPGSEPMVGAGCGVNSGTSADGPAEYFLIENTTTGLTRGWSFEFAGDWRSYETYNAGKLARSFLLILAYDGAQRMYLNTMRLASDAALDPAQSADLVTMADTNTITGPGSFGNVRVSDFSTATPGRDNTITDTNISGSVTIDANTETTTISNVNFTGSARAVITVGSGSTAVVTDLCVPNGSTITGAGTLNYEGSVETDRPFYIPNSTANCSITADPRPGPVTGGSVN
jgi:hypothetical protein